MKNWIKRFFGIGNNEPYEDYYDSPIHSQSNYNNQDKYDAKVVYEYPKGKFRFPVIPDDVNMYDNKDVSTLEQKAIQKDSNIQHVRAQRELRRQIRNEKGVGQGKKGPFKPTDVPSPIYGFGERPQKRVKEISVEDEVIINNNDRVIVRHTKDSESYVEIAAQHKSANDMQHKSTNDVQHKNANDVQHKSTNDVQHKSANDVQHKSTNDLEHQSINEPQYKSISESQHKNTNDLQNEQRSVFANNSTPLTSNEYEAKDAQNKKQVVKTNNSERTIPFNVLMYKQDKLQSSPTRIQADGNNGKESGLRLLKPNLHLLNMPVAEIDNDEEWFNEQSVLLNQAFDSFNVGAKVVRAKKGPAVTQFEVQPEHGVRVNKITNLADDLKLALAAKDIRIEAPIPGKSTVGIEVPNRKSRPVVIREILQSSVFQTNKSPLAVALGLDISGQPIVTDIKKMPHGLIAGATGSGKSVCINSIIISLLYKASPHEVKLLLIDPKMVELAPYNDLPHLVSPVITDVKAATAALKWAVEEMERRYESFAHEGVRDITRYNEKKQSENEKAEMMPYLVIIIDELADLMMVSPADVEEAICRIAQKARACGIHLLLATQRPSVDVITGLIKANVPTRIAFSVSSQVDSRTIIDISGAEKLLGKGDMLFLENGSNKPVRIQGNFVSDDEIERVTNFVRKQMEPQYLFVQEELIKNTYDVGGDDELFFEACDFVIDQEGASASSLQRRFRIGYNRAARLIDMMEARGIISEPKGSKPRDVLLTKEQLKSLQHDGV
ncbi:DNA translocase FtsK [Calidifontibacillus oryziterrae]|uniref:DNA translocase FtsK n=1 Tax=Calidifontibacillus oryziterrae TaxID=1191699 RepID=UPI000367032B|nr:DNA translocase FtsK [Calidifontibacillus oryziterrae]